MDYLTPFSKKKAAFYGNVFQVLEKETGFASAEDEDIFDEDEEEIFDVQLREALRIMVDWIEVLKSK